MGEADNKEVNITYETLFEILRREKDKEELQKLSDGFFDDVIAYLEEKNISTNDMTLQSFEDKRKLEIENIRRILKDLYERREKKIVNLALNISRTKSNLIDTSALLKEEKGLFDCLIKGLDCGREEILNKLLDSKAPSFEEPKIEKPAEEDKEPEVSPGLKPEVKEQKSTKMIRFVNAVPKFVGKDLEEYGPFDEEDVANLPAELANVLIGKGRAEEIEEQ
jgi:DNA replication initiation complex subunit (GINS family)